MLSEHAGPQEGLIPLDTMAGSGLLKIGNLRTDHPCHPLGGRPHPAVLGSGRSQGSQAHGCRLRMVSRLTSEAEKDHSSTRCCHIPCILEEVGGPSSRGHPWRSATLASFSGENRECLGMGTSCIGWRAWLVPCCLPGLCAGLYTKCTQPVKHILRGREGPWTARDTQ